MTRLVDLLPLLLAVAGGTLYHIAAKSIPKALDPALALVAAYLTALAASVVAYLALPSLVPSSLPAASLTSNAPEALGSPNPLTAMWHPAVLVVGGGAFLIEMGFLLAYRAGWPVSLASIATNGLVALMLVPLGAGLFGEPFSSVKALGIVLCLAGLALLQR